MPCCSVGIAAHAHAVQSLDPPAVVFKDTIFCPPYCFQRTHFQRTFPIDILVSEDTIFCRHSCFRGQHSLLAFVFLRTRFSVDILVFRGHDFQRTRFPVDLVSVNAIFWLRFCLCLLIVYESFASKRMCRHCRADAYLRDKPRH